MIRNVNINDISDGKLYTSKDMVRLGCNDCSGCSACCQGMSDTIILDPYDMHLLTSGLNASFDSLMEKYIELRLVDGIILPNLLMDPNTDRCNFLSKEGRCTIHKIRPGICRLFPLGRIYDHGSYAYFLQKDECKKTNRSKVKISKWLGYPDFAEYEKFVADWHYFIKDLTDELSKNTDQKQLQKIQYMLLTLFYRKPFDQGRSFYEQFYERLSMIR